MKTLLDVRNFRLASHPDVNGTLVALEGGADIPFEIRRVFYVRTPTPAIRGWHAHRKCSQFLVCLNGAADVVCDDGRERATYRLDRLDQGLLIPPTIWAEQTYFQDNTVLLVLCDQLYDEADYIRDHAVFLRWRSAGNS